MDYTVRNGKTEPIPISREQLIREILGKYGPESWRGLHSMEVCIGSKHEDGILSEGMNGGLLFQPKGCFYEKYVRAEDIIRIEQNGLWNEYELIATAKDITEDDLAKYVDGEFNCMWRTRKGLVVGKLSVSSDGEYVLKNPYLADKKSVTGFSEILGDDELELEIPDNTVIVIEYSDARRSGKTAAWGVTNFASEDSVDLIE